MNKDILLFSTGRRFCKYHNKYYGLLKETNRQTRYFELMLFLCWSTVYDLGPTFYQHWDRLVFACTLSCLPANTPIQNTINISQVRIPKKIFKIMWLHKLVLWLHFKWWALKIQLITINLIG